MYITFTVAYKLINDSVRKIAHFQHISVPLSILLPPIRFQIANVNSLKIPDLSNQRSGYLKSMCLQAPTDNRAEVENRTDPQKKTTQNVPESEPFCNIRKPLDGNRRSGV
ncbi:hypothetical protein GWI33_007495 [Rhynchophorus ferrugineus]|uniref:Uncharacterized protein n=1 Tax=Rhynchophorus ferrugineus TaxID=354439 RepID=A0A834IIR9_RHYFE|nr:hypothetical protein GWI33_007495 [Rhynchophorus ferrugineus]